MLADARALGVHVRVRNSVVNFHVIQFHAISAPRLARLPGVEVISEGNGLAVLLW